MAAPIADDEVKLLQIFPNEVWEMILGEVKDVPNYHRISNASPHFRSLLMPRAPQILFPEVANPLIHQYVNVKESLPCRLVCQDWRKGVDQRLQTQDFYPINDEEMRDQFFGLGCRNLYDSFDSEQDFVKFEQHFDSCHLTCNLNPFLSRGVEINIEYNNADDLGLAPLEPIYTAWNRMLEKYGNHVWYLTVYLDMDYLEGVIDFYKRRLPTILQLTPNIRVLLIFCDDFFDEADEHEWEQASFPTLPHLESLYLPATPPSMSSIRELVGKSQYVRSAEIGFLPEAGLLRIYLELLPNLTRLQFGCCDSDDFEVFRSAKVSGKIRTLWLDMLDVDVPWTEIFLALESQVSETLTELRLRLPSSFAKGLEKAPGLALPNLKLLTLSMYGDGVPLDFLLPMRNKLEYLRVEVWLDKKRNKDVVIEKATELEEKGDVKLYGCWRELAKSGAWSKFPKLRLLQTAVYRQEQEKQEECHSSTRDQWEKAQISLQ